MISCKPCISNTSRHRSTRRKTAPRQFKSRLAHQKKRDILSDVSFCFTRLILPFPRKPPVDKPRRTVYTYCHQKGSDEEEAVFPRPKRGAPPAESTPPRTRPVPLPSRLRRAGRVSPVTAIESDGVCRISSADTALQKLEIQTVFLRSCALSRRKISRHPQRTVKMLRRP